MKWSITKLEKIIRDRSIRELGNPIVIFKLDIMKVIAKTENKLDIKLNIAKVSVSEIILLLFFLNHFKKYISR